MSRRTFACIAVSGVLVVVGIAISWMPSREPVRMVVPERVTATPSPDPNLRPELFVVAQIDAKFADDWKVERLFVYDDDSGDQIQTVFEVPSAANDFCSDGPRYAIPHADPSKVYRLEYLLWPTHRNSGSQLSENSKSLNIRTWTEYVEKDDPRDSDSVANATDPARS